MKNKETIYIKEFTYNNKEIEKKNTEDLEILKKIQKNFLFESGKISENHEGKIHIEKNKEIEKQGGIGFDGKFLYDVKTFPIRTNDNSYRREYIITKFGNEKDIKEKYSDIEKFLIEKEFTLQKLNF